MMNEADLDSLLQDWHNSAKHEGLVPVTTVCPTFARTPTHRGEQQEYEIAEDSIGAIHLEAIQKCMDELSLEHRTALQFEAMNLNARVKVWRSARLPADKAARELVIKAARADLMRRLSCDGRVL